jgi:hypothetical protein
MTAIVTVLPLLAAIAWLVAVASARSLVVASVTVLLSTNSAASG